MKQGLVAKYARRCIRQNSQVEKGRFRTYGGARIVRKPHIKKITAEGGRYALNRI